MIKIIDETKTKTATTTTNTEKNKRGQSYKERVGAKWFCCVLKLGFFQLICKASLILKSITLKQRELYSKAFSGGM